MSRSSGSLSTTSAHLIAIRLKSANKQIFRALLSLASAALLVRIMGMLNQIVVTGRFGAGAAMDAYFVASALPTLLAQLSGSAIESSVIPVYARTRARGREQASRFISTLLNLLLIITGLLTVLMLVFRSLLVHLSAPALDPYRAELAINLAPFIFPALVLMVAVGLLECVLNTEGQFGWPAYAGLLVPLTTAILVLTLGSANGVVVLCLGTIVGLCFQFCVVIVRIRRARLSYKPIIDLRNPALKKVVVTVWPVLVGALISQASPFIDQIFASFLSPGNISALSYALKLISVPVGVIFISVGRAALPYLARQAAIHDMKAFKETLRLYLWTVGAGTVLLTVFMLVFSHLLVQILFQRGAFTSEDTTRTASILMGFAVGLPPMAMGFITSKAFSALGRTKVLMGVTIFSVFANALFDYIFARLWQAPGIALATSAYYYCTMLILFFMLSRAIGRLDLFTPPDELLKVISKISIYDKIGIPYHVRQWVVRIGIAIAIFLVGAFGVLQNATYTLRAAFGSLVVLVLLRYPYLLLIGWVLIDAFIGSNIQFFQGNNLNTALTVPTLLLMAYLPIKQAFRLVPALAFLLIFFLWVFLGIGISPMSTTSFLLSWLLLLDCVAVIVLAIHVLTTERRLNLLIDAILLIAVFTAFYGIYGYITKQNGIADETGLFRISSIFGQTPPSFAFFLSIVIPLSIYRTFTLQGFKRMIGLMVVLSLLAALALTFTRTAFISVPVSIITMILFLPSKRMKIGLLGSMAALGGLAVLVGLVGNVPIFARFFSQDVTSLNGRTVLWQAILQHFDPTQLLGNGLTASDVLLTNLQAGVGGVIGTAPHNLFLGTLYDQGVIGVALLILMFIVLFFNLLSGARKASGGHRLMFATALASFVCVVIQSLDSNDIWNQSINIYFWVIIALPFALYWSRSQQSAEIVQEVRDEETEPRLAIVRPAKQEPVLHA